MKNTDLYVENATSEIIYWDYEEINIRKNLYWINKKNQY